MDTVYVLTYEDDYQETVIWHDRDTVDELADHRDSVTGREVGLMGIHKATKGEIRKLPRANWR